MKKIFKVFLLIITLLLITSLLKKDNIVTKAETASEEYISESGLIVNGGLKDTNYTHENGVLTIISDSKLILTGGSESNLLEESIIINSGLEVTLTLDNLFIESLDSYGILVDSSTDGTILTSLNIELKDNSVNIIKGAPSKHGLVTNICATTNINGNGVLKVYAGDDTLTLNGACGITGFGTYNFNSGTIYAYGGIGKSNAGSGIGSNTRNITTSVHKAEYLFNGSNVYAYAGLHTTGAPGIGDNNLTSPSSYSSSCSKYVFRNGNITAEGSGTMPGIGNGCSQLNFFGGNIVPIGGADSTIDFGSTNTKISNYIRLININAVEGIYEPTKIDSLYLDEVNKKFVSPNSITIDFDLTIPNGYTLEAETIFVSNNCDFIIEEEAYVYVTNFYNINEGGNIYFKCPNENINIIFKYFDNSSYLNSGVVAQVFTNTNNLTVKSNSSNITSISKTYTGKELTISSLTVTHLVNYKLNEDYQVEYENNIDVGTAILRIIPIEGGRLFGAPLELEFKIIPASIDVVLPTLLQVTSGKDDLLSLLPTPNLICMSLLIENDNFKQGSLVWYSDDTFGTKLTNEYLSSFNPGDTQSIYWKYTQTDINFETEYTGTLLLEFVDKKILDIDITTSGNNLTVRDNAFIYDNSAGSNTTDIYQLLTTVKYNDTVITEHNPITWSLELLDTSKRIYKYIEVDDTGLLSIPNLATNGVIWILTGTIEESDEYAKSTAQVSIIIPLRFYQLVFGGYVGGGDDVHEHSYGEWVITTNPTLISSGLLTRVCSTDSNHTENFTLPILNTTDYAYVVISEPTYNSLGKGRYAYSKDGQILNIYIDIPKKELSADFKINSAYVNLTQDINLIYRTTIPTGYTDFYMVFTFMGNEYKVTEYEIDSNGRYCFAFRNIMPQYMGETIDAKLYASVNNEKVYIEHLGYSIKQYAVNLLNKLEDIETNKVTRNVLSDLLEYGAAVQEYRNYNIDNLVTKDVVLSSTVFETLDESYNKQSFIGEASEEIKWHSAGLYLENTMSVRFGFKVNLTENTNLEDLKVVISINGRTTVYNVNELEADEDGVYRIYYRGVYAKEFDDIIEAYFLNKEEQIGNTLQYSVNTYIYKKQEATDEALVSIVKAIYNYGASTKSYDELN